MVLGNPQYIEAKRLVDLGFPFGTKKHTSLEEALENIPSCPAMIVALYELEEWRQRSKRSDFIIYD